MKAVYILPAFPAAAAVAGLIFLTGARWRWSRWIALVWSFLTLPALAFMAYRFWDHYVGPDTFSLWRFTLSPQNMSVLLPLAAISPFLLAAAEGRRRRRGWGGAVPAFSCFAIAAVFTAVLCDHLFLLAGMSVLATLCMVGAAAFRGRGSGRFLPTALFPLVLADLCLVLGVLFFYLSDPSRGLYYPAHTLEPNGRLAAACALMLAASLLRLGCIPLHRWLAGLSRGGKDFRLIHFLAVDLVLGTYLLYLVTQVFFHWGGTWVWVCFGVSLATLVEVLRELLFCGDRVEIWGLLGIALGANLALVASAGGQMAAAALRLGPWAGIAALALVNLGSESGEDKNWYRVLGGVSIMGIPPLAGFIWWWMEFQVLAGKLGGGASVVFIAALPIVFAAALIEGLTALLLPRDGEEDTPRIAAVVAAISFIAFLSVIGLYAGSLIDLLMREYGLPVNLPFSSWTTLGWAILISCAIAVLIMSARTLRRREIHTPTAFPTRALPLIAMKRDIKIPLSKRRKVLLMTLACDGLLYAALTSILIYLAFR
jgi:hypothetical protein